jgi:hypothetical protein
VFGGATIVLGEGSLCVAENLLVAQDRASTSQPRTWLAEVCGDGSEQQSKGAIRSLAEQRGRISGGSHPRACYNVEQPSRRGA